MLRNYLTVAVRSLLRHRMSSSMNILGLGTGIAAGIMVLVLVQHELTHDRHHHQARRIYRVVRGAVGDDGDREHTLRAYRTVRGESFASSKAELAGIRAGEGELRVDLRRTEGNGR